MMFFKKISLIFMLTSLVGLVFPVVNFNLVSNNIEFTSVMGVFEEEHENEEFEPEEREEQFYKVSESLLENIRFYKNKYKIITLYECLFIPKIHLPPPDFYSFS